MSRLFSEFHLTSNHAQATRVTQISNHAQTTPITHPLQPYVRVSSIAFFFTCLFTQFRGFFLKIHGNGDVFFIAHHRDGYMFEKLIS